MVKLVKSLGCMVASILMAVAVLGQEVSQALVVNRDAKLSGQQLSKGSYQVKFAGDKDGEMVVMKGKKELMKSSYKLMRLEHPAADNAVIYKAGADGAYLISRVEFKGSSVALVFE